MHEGHGFSTTAIDRALINMRLGIKPAYHISDKLSDEDIERALRTAAAKAFGDKTCKEK